MPHRLQQPSSEQPLRMLVPYQVLDFSKQRMADRANGILEFGVNHDFEDKNVFHFWERYSSNATMGTHNTQPEITKFMERVSNLLRETWIACAACLP